MVNLDDRELYTKTDKSGMGLQIRGLPAQCKRAWDRALNFDLPSTYSDVENIIVLGMGGSAIGGDFLRALTASPDLPMVYINRDYYLPSWADDKTLVIAASYSGNTEETLSAFEQGLDTPCKKLVISSGGKVSALAAEKGLPLFTIDHVSSPRAALGYSLMPLLGIMQRLGFIKGKTAEVESMVVLMEKMSGRCGEEVPAQVNPAKSLAIKMEGKVAVIYGAGILTDVARRWKTQINENSKAWAFFETFPELNHNSIVGYHYPAQLSGNIFVVLLRSTVLHPRTLIRYAVTGDLLKQNNVPFEYIDGEGDSPLSQLMGLVLFGDWVSYYLSMLYGVDPTPVPEIDILKKRLSDAK